MRFEDQDKTELLIKVLERHDVRYKPGFIGWQPVRCLNKEFHSHGDRTPSGSVNLSYGKYQCWACDLRGDAFDLMLELEGLKAKEAMEALEVSAEIGSKEPTWLV